MGVYAEKAARIDAAMKDAAAIPLTNETIPGLKAMVAHKRAMQDLLQQLYFQMTPEQQADAEALGVYPLAQCCVCHLVKRGEDWVPPPNGVGGMALPYASHTYCPKCADAVYGQLNAMQKTTRGA